MKTKSIKQFIRSSALFLGINLGWIFYQAATLPEARILAVLGGR